MKIRKKKTKKLFLVDDTKCSKDLITKKQVRRIRKTLANLRPAEDLRCEVDIQRVLQAWKSENQVNLSFGLYDVCVDRINQ